MAEFMKKKSFIRSNEGLIASYNNVDLATGVGYLSLYLIDLNDTEYGLTTQAFNAKVGKISMSSSTNADFDVLFGKDIIVEGECYISLPLSFFQRGSGSPTIAATATLYHVTSAGVETSIASDTETISAGSLGDSGITKFYVAKETITKRKFKKGERLRITITSGNVSTGNCGVVMGCDPADKTAITINAGAGEQPFTAISTRSVIELPIKIEL